MFDALQNLCVNKHSLFSIAPTILLFLAPANDAVTPVVQSKIKIFSSLKQHHLVEVALSASYTACSFQLTKRLLKTQYWVQSHIVIQNWKEWCLILCLHNKPTTPKPSVLDSMLYIPKEKKKTDILTLQCWVQSHSLYIYGKENCSMLSLHDKPTLTPNNFNAGFNALLICQHVT